MVADFYEVPRARLDELHDLALRGWGWTGAKERPLEMLSTLRHPVPRREEEGFYLRSVIRYLNENSIVELQPEGDLQGLLTDLAQNHGGAWALLEPRLATIDALDPRRFDPAILSAFHVNGGEPDPDAGAAMLADLQAIRGALLTIVPQSVLLMRLH